MNSYYVVPFQTPPTPEQNARAEALGCTPVIGDPTGEVTAWPSVVVTSPKAATVVIPDDQGQATLAAVQVAQNVAIAAEDAVTNGIQAAVAALQADIALLGPGLAQATADAATCAASTDPLAPIVGRLVVDVATIAKSIGDLLVADQVIEASQLPGGP